MHKFLHTTKLKPENKRQVPNTDLVSIEKRLVRIKGLVYNKL